jgi:hypothetical protein
MPTPAEQEILDLMIGLGATAQSIHRWVAQVNRAAELGRELRDGVVSEQRQRAIGSELAAWTEPAAPAAQRFAVLAAVGANVRQGPGTDFPVVRTLPAGTAVICDREQAGGEVPGAGNLWRHLGDDTGWVHSSLLGVEEPFPMVTLDSSLIAPPRSTAARATSYLQTRPNGAYTAEDVREIVELYFSMAPTVGLDPLVAVAQLVHETAFLSSFWSQPPHHNPAGIGVTGEPGAGVSFSDWSTAARAHVGRLLAYALTGGGATQTQRALIDEALTHRPLPDTRRGVAPTLRGLTGTWGLDPSYSEKVVNHARGIQES